MIAVIFELQPADGQRETYLDLAAELKPLLAEIDGFISIERFQSLADPQRLLSLSFWRDEAAVQQWRNIEKHRAAQTRGRHGVLAQYRLCVAEVVRDYGLDQREQAPQDSRGYHVD
ncbi:antibiotic biosynthesis monooxygenase family protein [Serratia proteamaculans]|uniref:antibiotic biosynthesis monooxygenase family protein n=1 Tax=Serratia proteamaculans TaxID=28151 RepID=UPI0021837C39|nr:antibiotic biosynthesis monooxygenase [Serratia proteamaculans]CAI2459948.1 Antibiotic biosynthesis monooxygenase [Serratia proteamaculans]